MLSQRINGEFMLIKNEIKEMRDDFERKLTNLQEQLLKLEDTKRKVSNGDPSKETDRNLQMSLYQDEIERQITSVTKAFQVEKNYIRSFERQVNRTLVEFKTMFHGLLENVIQETLIDFREISFNISDQMEQMNNIFLNQISTDRNIQKIARKQIKLEKQMAEAKIAHQELNARLESGKIAFSAYVHTNQDTKGGETIKFDAVLYSIGGGYNESSGIFTCPETGVYLFSVTLQCDPRQGKTLLTSSLKVNSMTTVSMLSRSTGKEDYCSQGSILFILHLSKGQTVCIETYGRDATVLKDMSIFSGTLLYRETSL